MFNNIGEKIKNLATVVCWLGIIASLISGIAMTGGITIISILIIVVGALLSWIGSFTLYGFGELIENSSIIARHYCDLLDTEQGITKVVSKEKEDGSFDVNCKLQCIKCGTTISKYPCKNCGHDEDYIDIRCPSCKEQISFEKGETKLICPYCNTPVEMK